MHVFLFFSDFKNNPSKITWDVGAVLSPPKETVWEIILVLQEEVV